MTKLCSVLIVEDEHLIRACIRTFVERIPNVHVVGEASNGREALHMVEELHPDLVLTDLCMPLLDGVGLTRFVRSRCPNVAVLILSGYGTEANLASAMSAGAAGFVLKSSDVDELAIAIRAAVNGEPYLTPKMTKPLVSERFVGVRPRKAANERLTLRQRETLQLIVTGLTNKEIAVSLNISTKTVEKHRTDIMERLDVHNLVGLIRYALDHDLI
jgi:DNA-binding NarL/FixJ family response regulator